MMRLMVNGNLQWSTTQTTRLVDNPVSKNWRDVLQLTWSSYVLILISNSFNYSTFFPLSGEWKPKQIDNPNYKGEWIHPEIDNPEYQPDDKLYKYDDIGAIGFDLWQVSHNCFLFTTCDLSKSGV